MPISRDEFNGGQSDAEKKLEQAIVAFLAARPDQAFTAGEIVDAVRPNVPVATEKEINWGKVLLQSISVAVSVTTVQSALGRLVAERGIISRDVKGHTYYIAPAPVQLR